MAKARMRDGQKFCPGCEQFKDLSAYGKDQRTALGVSCRCLLCSRRDYNKWRAAHADEQSAHKKQYRLENRDRIRALDRRPLRRMAKVATAARWRHNNPHKVAEINARRRAKVGVSAKHSREYRARHPEISRLRDQTRRSRRFGKAARFVCDEDTVAYMRIIANDPCAYCGGEATTTDHIVPLIDGGSVGWMNLAPACGSCNSRKSDRSLLRWMMVS